jgi:uncharacterized protein YjbJ (UPF0337 family)
MEEPENDKSTLAESISGLGQKVIGEIEKLAGIVNADPLAQAEGEFNIEVGEIREEIEEDLDKKGEEHPAGGSW